ncbi:MAG TPA: hypothetical protein VGP72_06130 [Planctomycetota bacterium]|jgi:type II secretory pathway pseudopilin PulG
MQTNGRIRIMGLTLLEFVIATAIIGLLLLILAPIAGGPSTSHRPRATRTLIDGVSAALERYCIQFGSYPPSTVEGMGDAPEPGSLFKYLCGPDGKGVTKVAVIPAGSRRIITFDPFISIPENYLRPSGPDTLIVDSWGNPLVYLNCRHYTLQQKAKNPNYVPDGKCHNPNNYDLYSTGQDGKPDPPGERGDDITNWPK